jgi:hypothetical protein
MRKLRLASAVAAGFLLLHLSAPPAIAQSSVPNAVLQRLVATVPCDTDMPTTSAVDLDIPLTRAEACAVMSTAWALVASMPADTAIERPKAGRPYSGVNLSEYSMESVNSVTQRLWLVEFTMQLGGAVAVTVSQVSGETTGPFFVHAAPATRSSEK